MFLFSDSEGSVKVDYVATFSPGIIDTSDIQDTFMQEIEEGPDGAFHSLTIDRNSTSFKGTYLLYVISLNDVLNICVKITTCLDTTADGLKDTIPYLQTCH